MLADRRIRAIKQILRNDTYMMDSRLYQQLETALNRLSVEVLENLDLLISLKETEAMQRGRKLDSNGIS